MLLPTFHNNQRPLSVQDWWKLVQTTVRYFYQDSWCPVLTTPEIDLRLRINSNVCSTFSRRNMAGCEPSIISIPRLQPFISSHREPSAAPAITNIYFLIPHPPLPFSVLCDCLQATPSHHIHFTSKKRSTRVFVGGKFGGWHWASWYSVTVLLVSFTFTIVSRIVMLVNSNVG